MTFSDSKSTPATAQGNGADTHLDTLGAATSGARHRQPHARAVKVAILGRFTKGLLVAALSATSFANVARADGAFPDSQAVLLSLERPQQIILASNFGLVFSEDDGQTWQYACETAATASGRLYALGAAPDERIVAVSDRGAVSSVDGGCNWTVGGGHLQGALVSDIFPDPSDPLHILAVAKSAGAGLPLPARVFASADGGSTYATVAFDGTFTDSGGITGAEIARSDPRVIYITTFETTAADGAVHPRLHRSQDGGATYDSVDLEPMLGKSRASIAAVDPGEARHIFLRVIGTNAQMRSEERIAVSTDGGITFVTPITLTGGTLTSFLARRNGTVLVSGRLTATVIGYRSQDGGGTFANWHVGIHPRGFGERGTTLFAATDSATDGFALASSTDDGDTWTPRFRFADIQGPKSCVQQQCRPDCLTQAERGLFEAALCGEGGSGAVGDGGAGSGGASGGKTPPGRGSGCTVVPGDEGLSAGHRDGAIPRPQSPPEEWLPTTVLALAAALTLRRSRPRTRTRTRRRTRRPPPRRPAYRAGPAALLPFLFLLAPSPAHAYVQSRTSSGHPYRWPSSCVPLEVHLSDLPGLTAAEMRAAVEEAARSWTMEANPCTSLRFALSFSDAEGPATNNDGHNVIAARSDGWCGPGAALATPATCNPPSARAATQVFARSSDGRIVGADTQLNSVDFSWAALNDAGEPLDRHDLQGTLTHELGHVLGLEHPCSTGIGPAAIDDQGLSVPNCYGASMELMSDTMFPRSEPGSIATRILSPDVLHAMCEIYPARQSPSAGAEPPTGLLAACPVDDAGGCAVAPGSAQRGNGTSSGPIALTVTPLGIALSLTVAWAVTRPPRRRQRR